MKGDLKAMLNYPDFYMINVEIDERNSRDVEPFSTWEEAMTARMKYANWWRPNGDVHIHKISGKTMKTIERWHISENGSIISHYYF